MEEHEIRRQNQRLQERSASTMSQMERTQRLLNRIKGESARKSTEMDKLQHEFSSLGDRLRSLENKAMEAEKLEIAVETLKKNVENTQQEVRDKEREVRTLQRLMEAKDKEITNLETKTSSMEITNHDLKIQIREEIVKNTALEMRIENTDRMREDLSQRERDVEALRREMEEQSLVALHARKCLREEREKCKRLEEDAQSVDVMREEVVMVTSENHTLKRLLAAKDSMLQQRNKMTEQLKNVLRERMTSQEYNDVMKSIEKNTAAPTPNRNSDRRTRTEVTDSKCQGRSAYPNGHEHHEPKAHQQQNRRSQLLKTIMDGDRSTDDENSSHNHTKTAVMRPRVYNGTFSDFRSNSPSCSDVTSLNSLSTCNGSHGNVWRGNDRTAIRRTQSMRVSSTQGSRSSMRSASMEPGNAWHRQDDRGQSRQNSAPSRDIYSEEAKLKSCLKAGDRVVVDMSKKKGSSKDLQTGLVKYVGHLDSDRVYVGIKLDGPDGDSDGLHQGKRYFRVSPCYGKFIRISKVLSVFDKESGSYCKLEAMSGKSRQQGSQITIQSLH